MYTVTEQVIVRSKKNRLIDWIQMLEDRDLCYMLGLLFYQPKLAELAMSVEPEWRNGAT